MYTGTVHEFDEEAKKMKDNMDLNLVIGIVGVFLSILVPLIGAWRAWRNRYIYSWKKVCRAVHTIYEEMKAQGVEPDVIVAFAKGGLIVADLLNHEFGNRLPICTFYTRRLTRGRERVVEINTTYANLDNLVGKKILLVDDVVQSGSTLREVVHLLTETHRVDRKNIVVAVLAVPKAVTLFDPDFHVFEFEYGEKRPVLPWGVVPKD